MNPLVGKINIFPYPIRQSVGALLSESDWRLHISKHFVHVTVMYPSSTKNMRRLDKKALSFNRYLCRMLPPSVNFYSNNL